MDQELDQLGMQIDGERKARNDSQEQIVNMLKEMITKVKQDVEG